MTQSDHFKAKVVLLGEGAVGKTSIAMRYVKNTFNNQHVMTLQVLLLWLTLTPLICMHPAYLRVICLTDVPIKRTLLVERGYKCYVL